MSPLNFTHILTQAVDELSESESYKGLFHQHKDGEPLPSAKVLYEIIELSRSILFPGYYGNSTINSRTINYHIGVNIEKLFDLLTEQILAGLCFGTSIEGRCNACSDSKREEAARLAAKFISKHFADVICRAFMALTVDYCNFHSLISTGFSSKPFI